MKAKNVLKIKKFAAWACVVAIAAPLIFFAFYFLFNRHTHDFNFMYTTATCEYAGQNVFICECDEFKVEDAPALGHNYQPSKEFSRLNACSRADCLSGELTPPDEDFTEKMIYDFGEQNIEQTEELNADLLSRIQLVGEFSEAEHAYDKNSALYQSNLLFEDVFKNYEDSIDYITSQYQYARIFYFIDMQNEQLKENYLSVSEFRTNTISAYYSLFSKIYNSAFRNYFFHDYTEEEIEYVLYQSECVGNEQYALLNNRNNEIEVESDGIKDTATSAKICELYEEFVENNNKIAQLFGYENYLDYAYENVYDREYSYKDAEQIGEYIKEHLSPVFNSVLNKYNWLFSAAGNWTLSEINQYNSIIVYSFFNNVISNDAVNDFVEKMNGQGNKEISYLKEFEGLFKNGNYFRGDYKGAFEWYLYELETPIIFWGEGYESAFTIVHEFGHYINDVYNQNRFSQSYDLLETHSQGNEMMFLFCLKEYAAENAFNLIKFNRLYDSLVTIINCAAVNTFEQAIYTGEYSGTNALQIMADGKISSNEYDLLYTSILQDFGVINAVNNSYWRYVTIKSPCYYISYSVSMACSLQLFVKAENEGFDQALKSYLALITYTDEHSEFNYKEVLEYADLFPYDSEELYININKYLIE